MAGDAVGIEALGTASGHPERRATTTLPPAVGPRCSRASTPRSRLRPHGWRRWTAAAARGQWSWAQRPRAVGRRAGRPPPSPRHRRAPRRRGPLRPGRDGRGRRRGRRQRPAPRRPGGHGDRQVASPTSSRPSCRAAPRSWPPPRRRCRTSWPPRTCRSWPSTSTSSSTWAVLKGRSNYLCLQRVREVRDPGAASWSSRTCSRRTGTRSSAWRPGPPRPPPVTGPSWTGAPASGRGPR